MNNEKRTIFIGDVHGCFDEFELLIEKLNIQEDDIVYLVGDMINKGPKSWKMIKFLYKNQDQYKAVLGNHEVYFSEWLKGNNYGNEIFEKLKIKFEKHFKIFDYFNKIPSFINEENFILIHGGLDISKKIEEHSIEELTEIREVNDKPWFEQYNGDKKVIYGHWAQNGLNIYGNTIGLDGGCVYGRALHAYVLETGDIVTQQALECYQDVFKKD